MENINSNWYDRNYKILLIIPVIILLIALVYLFNFNSKNGDLIYKDVSLTGGTTITLLDEKISVDSLKAEFPESGIKVISDIRSGKQIGVIIETKETSETFNPKLEKFIGYKLTSDNSSVEFSGSSISEGFYKQLRLAIILAFFLMAITVFVIFRSPIPSLAIVFAAFSDIVLTITTVNLMGIEVSIAGIVGFLMLIGYSVDTDILLTTRVLKSSEGSINQRIYGAFKTGMTMTLTAIATVTVSFIAIYGLSDTLRQIFGIILIGLLFDIINTWCTNGSIIKWYAERKK